MPIGGSVELLLLLFLNDSRSHKNNIVNILLHLRHGSVSFMHDTRQPKRQKEHITEIMREFN